MAMASTTSEKVKEIVLRCVQSYYGQKKVAFMADYFDKWAITEEGSRLVGELGEVRKEDWADKLAERLEELMINIPKQTEDADWWNDALRASYDASSEMLEKYYDKFPLPEPPKP